MISRERSESDRRAQQLRLTKRGTDLVVKALGQLLAEDGELLAHLTDGERRILLELLHKVALKRARR